MIRHYSWCILVLGASLLASCGEDGGGGTPAADAGVEDTGVEEDGGGEDAAADVAPDVSFIDVGLVINEVSAAGEPMDWVELYNGTGEAVDLGTWRLTDDPVGKPQGSLFPAGTVVGPGAYLRVFVDDSTLGFKLGGDEEVALLDPSGQRVDGVDWDEGQSPPGGSFGRIPDVTGDFKVLLSETPGAPNLDNPGGATCGNMEVEEGEECDDGNLISGDGCSGLCRTEVIPVCGNMQVEAGEECDDGNDVEDDGCTSRCLRSITPGLIVINEVVPTAAESGADWFELLNQGAEAVSLEGWFVTDDDPTHTYLFPAGTTLEPGVWQVWERGEGSFDFGLGSADALVLRDGDGMIIDRAVWSEGEAEEGASWGRVPDGTGPFQTATPTRGASNAAE